MPSFSKLLKSAKHSLTPSKQRDRSGSSSSNSGKSVRFSKSSESIYYTHSSLEYDRRSSLNYDDYHEADSLKSFSSSDAEEILFDEEVIRNTKVNKKQGHYSIAALVAYRSTI